MKPSRTKTISRRRAPANDIAFRAYVRRTDIANLQCVDSAAAVCRGHVSTSTDFRGHWGILAWSAHPTLERIRTQLWPGGSPKMSMGDCRVVASHAGPRERGLPGESRATWIAAAPRPFDSARSLTARLQTGPSRVSRYIGGCWRGRDRCPSVVSCPVPRQDTGSSD